MGQFLPLHITSGSATRIAAIDDADGVPTNMKHTQGVPVSWLHDIVVVSRSISG